MSLPVALASVGISEPLACFVPVSEDRMWLRHRT
jgi:hypothetical protein